MTQSPNLWLHENKHKEAETQNSQWRAQARKPEKRDHGGKKDNPGKRSEMNHDFLQSQLATITTPRASVQTDAKGSLSLLRVREGAIAPSTWSTELAWRKSASRA